MDIEHIMRLGGWESLDMVVRYTRSVKFEGSLRLYRRLNVGYVGNCQEWTDSIAFQQESCQSGCGVPYSSTGTNSQ